MSALICGPSLSGSQVLIPSACEKRYALTSSAISVRWSMCFMPGRKRRKLLLPLLCLLNHSRNRHVLLKMLPLLNGMSIMYAW